MKIMERQRVGFVSGIFSVRMLKWSFMVLLAIFSMRGSWTVRMANSSAKVSVLVNNARGITEYENHAYDFFLYDCHL